MVVVVVVQGQGGEMEEGRRDLRIRRDLRGGFQLDPVDRWCLLEVVGWR